MTSNDFQDKLEELGNFARIEGAELGEYWNLLCELESSRIDHMTPEFEAAYMKEVIETVEYIKQNFNIVEEEVTSKYIDRRLEEI